MRRPDNWGNPFEGSFERCNKSYPQGIPKGYHILQDAGYEEGYEAGADAMLEALKNESLPKDIANAIAEMHKGNLPTDWNRPNGQVVFIPDEEEGKRT